MRFTRLFHIFSFLFFVFSVGSAAIAQDAPSSENSAAEGAADTQAEMHEDPKEEAAKKNAKRKEGADEWERHKSVTESYEVKFPKEYKYNVFPFQYNDTNVAYSAEIFANMKKNAENRTVFIRSMATLGTELSVKRAEKALNDTAKRYVSLAENLNGNVIENEDIEHYGYLAKKIYITYMDKDVTTEGKTALRIALLATNYAIIEQVVTGPAAGMYSYKADDFFKSIKLQDGIAKSDTPIGTGWIDTPSKNNIFTAKLPPKNKDYTPFETVSQSSKSRDRIYYKIKDPVTENTLHYIMTAYKLKSRPDVDMINSILSRHHLSKFIDSRKSRLSMKTRREEDGTKVMETSVIISPIASLPYISKLFYEIEVKGNFVLVKEFLSGVYHNKTGIEKTFFKLTDFHPEKYSYTPKKKSEPKKSGKSEKKK